MKARLLSPKELSEYLQIPVGTLYQWRQKKIGPPAVRVGHHLRWQLEDVEEWLDSGKCDAKSE